MFQRKSDWILITAYFYNPNYEIMSNFKSWDLYSFQVICIAIYIYTHTYILLSEPWGSPKCMYVYMCAYMYICVWIYKHTCTYNIIYIIYNIHNTKRKTVFLSIFIYLYLSAYFFASQKPRISFLVPFLYISLAWHTVIQIWMTCLHAQPESKWKLATASKTETSGPSSQGLSWTDFSSILSH